ncbi:MAG: FtsQ-type POTRA domain-containing protein [Clostridium sp.]|nr:FtsQ-type POTRA domain-containing protein [Acetatifactor muris]MCM1562159.1 FtsQ-type POTRA domain-containing protein [Clostridium sp.]
MYRLRRGKTAIAVITVALMLTVALGGIGWYVWDTHTVRTVFVEGNVHYSEEEIKALVMDGVFGNNSLYLSMKYKNRGIEDVPFLDAMDVNILSPDTIRITVYEKALAGYVKCMGTYVYFDKDGYAVESSTIRTAGVPQVTGLDFDHMVLGQPLPVEEEYREVFGTILDITKLLNKYELTADRIFFHSDSEITVYFGEVKVALGDETDRLEDKIVRLSRMLPGLSGRKGTLQMETYNEKGDYTFKPE